MAQLRITPTRAHWRAKIKFASPDEPVLVATQDLDADRLALLIGDAELGIELEHPDGSFAAIPAGERAEAIAAFEIARADAALAREDEGAALDVLARANFGPFAIASAADALRTLDVLASWAEDHIEEASEVLAHARARFADPSPQDAAAPDAAVAEADAGPVSASADRARKPAKRVAGG